MIAIPIKSKTFGEHLFFIDGNDFDLIKDYKWSFVRNRKKSIKSKSSKYKGVYFHKVTNKYLASIKFNKVSKHLGLYKNQEDAAEAYNKAAKIYHGEFAKLNKIEV